LCSTQSDVVFQVPDHGWAEGVADAFAAVTDGAADGVSVAFVAAAADVVSAVAGADGIGATVVAAGVVTGVVPEELVHPAAISMTQTRPERIIASNFFIK